MLSVHTPIKWGSVVKRKGIRGIPQEEQRQSIVKGVLWGSRVQ